MYKWKYEYKLMQQVKVKDDEKEKEKEDRGERSLEVLTDNNREVHHDTWLIEISITGIIS